MMSVHKEAQQASDQHGRYGTQRDAERRLSKHLSTKGILQIFFATIIERNVDVFVKGVVVDQLTIRALADSPEFTRPAPLPTAWPSTTLASSQTLSSSHHEIGQRRRWPSDRLFIFVINRHSPAVPPGDRSGMLLMLMWHAPPPLRCR